MIQLTIQAARLGAGSDASQRSATVVIRDLGHLAVQVFFHEQPMPGLEVQFKKVDDEGEPGDPVGAAQHTDARGIASLPYAVEGGVYACQIEHQEPALVATVEQPDQPCPVVLPVGRAYFEIDGNAEFGEPS